VFKTSIIVTVAVGAATLFNWAPAVAGARAKVAGAAAAVQVDQVTYPSGEDAVMGYLATPMGPSSLPKAGLVVIHEW